MQTALPDGYVQILEARPIVGELRGLSDADGVRKVIVDDVKAMQVAKVNQVRFFKYGRRGSRRRIGAPWRSVSEMLQEDTLATAYVQCLCKRENQDVTSTLKGFEVLPM